MDFTELTTKDKRMIRAALTRLQCPNCPFEQICNSKDFHNNRCGVVADLFSR